MMAPGERPEDGQVPEWPPPSFEAVDVGGGKPALRENGLASERTRRELIGRCPPGYGRWLVGEGVSIPKRRGSSPPSDVDSTRFAQPE